MTTPDAALARLASPEPPTVIQGCFICGAPTENIDGLDVCTAGCLDEPDPKARLEELRAAIHAENIGTA